VTYTNQKPAYYLNRQFKIECSEMNGRFVSNAYSQTLTVVHPKVLKEDVEKPQAAAHRMEPPALHAHMILDEQSIDEVGFKRYVIERGGAHGNVVAIVAVVFAAFLIALLVLGVVRVRAGHNRELQQQQQQQQDMEMQWDDSGLNITVNPMEEAGSESKMIGVNQDDLDEEDEDEDSLYDEDEDEDYDDEVKVTT